MIQKLKTTVVGIEHNMNLVPAHVQCDDCGDQYKAGYKYMSTPVRATLAEELRGAGWLVEGDHERHVCPTCRAGTR